jgi:hypothetical protein
VGWRELFQGLRYHGTFTALRDAWQEQLGIPNAATVNRRLGRLIRCGRCSPESCPRCFCGALLQTEPPALLEQLERIAGGRSAEAAAWIATALGELVVERVTSFGTPPIRAALEAARSAPDRERLLALIAALRGI